MVKILTMLFVLRMEVDTADMQQLELFPANDYTQRWRERKHSWRHKSEGGFNRADYEIAVIHDDTTARTFVCTHHYSGTYPAARLRYGLYTQGGLLVGVAVLSIP